jgi:transcriptional regulator with XRE-family HTH domain
LAALCEVIAPTVHCQGCGIAQFLKPKRTRCLRCGRELQTAIPVAEIPQELVEPESPELIYSRQEYIRRLENQICLVLRDLRKNARLSQREVAQRAGFGNRSYVSKVENPFSLNRTIPTLDSIERLSVAMEVESWRVVALADKRAGTAAQDEWTVWWHEMLIGLRKMRREERGLVLSLARNLHHKNIASGAQ